MKRIAFVFSLLAIVAISAQSQRVRLCTEPTMSMITVYNTDTPEEAELVVYRTTDQALAVGSENNGFWYFVSGPGVKPDKDVFVVNSPNKAELLVYFTDNPAEAGWKKNLDKKYLLMKRP